VSIPNTNNSGVFWAIGSDATTNLFIDHGFIHSVSHPSRLELTGEDSMGGQFTVDLDGFDFSVPHTTSITFNGTHATVYLDGVAVANGTLMSPTLITDKTLYFSLDPMPAGNSATVSRLLCTQ